MAGGRDREYVTGWLTAPSIPGETGRERLRRLQGEQQDRDSAASSSDRELSSPSVQRRAEREQQRRLARTRPERPGWCWVVVELYGHVVERPGVVARWVSTPQAWMALVAWSDLDGAVRIEWLPADRLVAMTPQAAP